MSVRLKILGSSSSGNCALLCTGETRVLIDAGLSGRRIVQELAKLDLKPEDLDAVFLTHEHSDHAQGMTGLARYDHLKVFANGDTLQAIQPKLKRSVEWMRFETGGTFAFRDLTIRSFAVPHDAYDPVGFVFSAGGDSLFDPLRRIGWATDLGHLPLMVKEQLLEADVLLMEANYDEHLLENDVKRPWSLKQRIRGRHGHLSNATALEYLADYQKRANWQSIFLGHLSRDCNSTQTLGEQLTRCGLDQGRTRVTVLHPERCNEGSGFDWEG